MTRRRWIADEVTGDRAILRGQNAYHLARVLRAKVGQQFDLLAGGRVRQARISKLSDDRVEFELGGELPASDLPIEITLLLSIFKFDRMEWALEKATELGVAGIIPVIARRTETHLAAAAAKRVDRWQRIAHQAAQQARRASIPEVSPPAKLRAILAQGIPGIVLAECEQEASLKNALAGMKSGKAIRLAVGPEGGWTTEELESFGKAQWRAASLGTNILRAETAAIAALAVAISELT